MAKIKLNGKDMDVPAGKPLLQGCLDAGAYVPHYCYHPGLTPAGNCRMCLVKVSNSRKLEASCMYPASDGLEVTTEGPEVEKARRDVMEFLLINHPLDCPICDKAGECALQDYTYTYRGGLSRFQEPKNIRPTKDLGPNIKIWGNRCIVCTRCVRFTDEISGSGELCVVNRGDHSVVDVFPGVPIDNPLSLNVVDICPVGALIDKNFLFAARVWFAQQTKTVCGSCSRGCNGTITALDGQIKRFIARSNPDVNQFWMCDEGRLNHKFVRSEKRLTVARGTARELASAAQAIAAKHGEGSVGGIVSAWNTVEEMYLFRKLMGALKARYPGLLTLTRGERQKFPGGFVIENDKTPNRAGGAILYGAECAEAGLEGMVSAAASGRLKGLIVLNGIPDFEYPEALVAAARKLEFLAVLDIQASPLSDAAHVLLPGATWAEKDGTFVNIDRRAQRIRRAVAPPGSAAPEIEALQNALVDLGARERVVSAEGVFREVAKDVKEFAGLDYGRLGLQGAPLAGAGTAAP
ncbi:MAG TPA: 2Fe-2S iron-sulfur cluster-binding protein [Planctomycetota bacterium]|nr:2Fe-2S iron-sulfur cluster-binding protein [Planctomycetota bacterium]